MKNKTLLITGANGEVGHGLIDAMYQQDATIIAVDVRDPDPAIRDKVSEYIVGDITDINLLRHLHDDYEIDVIYHMAALLSTSAEKQPMKAHAVNVQGTLNLLDMARAEAESNGRDVIFMFPSSIAVYGVPGLHAKAQFPRIRETQYLEPITMYGVTKLHGEHLGRYFAQHHGQMSNVERGPRIDFRGVRFPGLISATTLPSGGTSDYGPEMLHHAAQGKDYVSFVRPDTAIPFMTMSDAVKALLQLTNAPRNRLSRHIYNITSFSLSAAEIAERVLETFPSVSITYEPTPGRQRIVDSWPADLDDSAARHDWDWEPEFDAEAAFADYLIPAITAYYGLRIEA